MLIIITESDSFEKKNAFIYIIFLKTTSGTTFKGYSGSDLKTKGKIKGMLSFR